MKNNILIAVIASAVNSYADWYYTASVEFEADSYTA